jgi:hypothetical protein
MQHRDLRPVYRFIVAEKALRVGGCMAVLVEGISVVIRRDAIVRTFGPSWDAFVVAVPNRTLCADPEIARVGFMHPDDVQAYVVQLGTKGMLHLRTENAVDLVVVDQLRGPTSHCDWLDFGSVDLQGHKVSAARLKGSALLKTAVPDGWTYATSLSSGFTFVSKDAVPLAIGKVTQQDGMGAARDLDTNQELFMGRTQAGLDRAPLSGEQPEPVLGRLWRRIRGAPKS